MFYRPGFDRIMCCRFHLHVRSKSTSRTTNVSCFERRISRHDMRQTIEEADAVIVLLQKITMPEERT
jgi:hypothetical protein